MHILPKSNYPVEHSTMSSLALPTIAAILIATTYALAQNNTVDPNPQPKSVPEPHLDVNQVEASKRYLKDEHTIFIGNVIEHGKLSGYSAPAGNIGADGLKFSGYRWARVKISSLMRGKVDGTVIDFIWAAYLSEESEEAFDSPFKARMREAILAGEEQRWEVSGEVHNREGLPPVVFESFAVSKWTTPADVEAVRQLHQEDRQREKNEFAIKFYGSAENLALILTANKVTACRLRLPRDKNGEVDHEKFRADSLKYYTPEPEVAVPEATLKELRSILQDPGSRDTIGGKACMPTFGVRVTFVKGKKTLTVNFCFLCSILVTASQSEQIVGGGGFDPVEKKLMEIAQSLFPKDTDLMDLR